MRRHNEIINEPFFWINSVWICQGFKEKKTTCEYWVREGSSVVVVVEFEVFEILKGE